MFGPLVAVHVAGLLGAGAWAQKLEGSSKLSRPFGYYGGVIGAAAGIGLAGALGADVMRLFALMAVAGPWVQALGRLRCLAQGCCHGFVAPEGIGIRYRNPRSRVCALADLGGLPLHPTPLYSILSNIVIGALLLRLWSLGASFGLIAGAYLLLVGVSRFVEESYRGEPQTLIMGGLRLYQWMAILSFLAGVILTTIPSARSGGLVVVLDSNVILAGLLFGTVVGFSMGVDFPGSARRFARLAPP
jgi:prolipoprotein diacylglyceryltransferase